MRKTNEIKIRKESISQCKEKQEKLTLEGGLSLEDYYRALIWNSILDVTNVESLRYLVNAAMTFSHREKSGCCDTTRSFEEFIASEEETKRFLSEE